VNGCDGLNSTCVACSEHDVKDLPANGNVVVNFDVVKVAHDSFLLSIVLCSCFLPTNGSSGDHDKIRNVSYWRMTSPDRIGVDVIRGRLIPRTLSQSFPCKRNRSVDLFSSRLGFQVSEDCRRSANALIQKCLQFVISEHGALGSAEM